MKQIFFIVIASVMISCNNYDCQIKELKTEKIKFENLPSKVKRFFIDPSGYEKGQDGIIELANLDDTVKYHLETIKTRIGPWVAYYKLTDETRDRSYRINQGIPYPFVVYNNKLYLTDKFNVLTSVDDFTTLEFTCYTLIKSPSDHRSE
ncbi:hypothetical protein EYV94_28160 [Puteibacter caeruleilacunae]|nr:hypothetical protein EYV94_28160 [Puteibacter caeruleilacunae]